MAFAKLSGSLLVRRGAPPAASAAEEQSALSAAQALTPSLPPPQAAVSAAPLATVGDDARLLAQHLRALKLPAFARECDRLARQCGAAEADYPRFLLRLAELELAERKRRRIERLVKEARFRSIKGLDSFNFAAIPKLNEAAVRELAQCDYIARRENVIAIGNSGTGKTHIALGLGLAACNRGFSVGFTTAASLVHELLETRAERRMLRLQRRLDAYSLLIIDELGYVPLSSDGAEMLFEVISRRCERGSTLITSDLPTSEWADIFGTPRLTDALLDRLTCNVHILDMHGESYRLKQAQRLQSVFPSTVTAPLREAG